MMNLDDDGDSKRDDDGSVTFSSEKITCSKCHGDDRNDDNATEMTTVIMINTSVTDHDDDDDDDGVGDGVIHDCDGGDDGQEEEKDGSLDHDKSHARTQDVTYVHVFHCKCSHLWVLGHSRATLIKQSDNKVTSGLTYDIFYPA
jgi:hypothetical protein